METRELSEVEFRKSRDMEYLSELVEDTLGREEGFESMLVGAKYVEARTRMGLGVGKAVLERALELVERNSGDVDMGEFESVRRDTIYSTGVDDRAVPGGGGAAGGGAFSVEPVRGEVLGGGRGAVGDGGGARAEQPALQE